MNRSNNLAGLVAERRTRYKIGALAAAAMAVGASPAGAQYGTDAPLPPLPPLQGTTAAPTGTTAPGATAAPSTSASPSTPTGQSGVAGATGSGNAAPGATDQSGVAGAVGSGDAVPAAGTGGEVRDTGVGAPSVSVVSSERAEPVAISGDNLPFTGARIGMLAAIGGGLLVLGLGVRRRSGLRAAKP